MAMDMVMGTPMVTAIITKHKRYASFNNLIRGFIGYSTGYIQ